MCQTTITTNNNNKNSVIPVVRWGGMFSMFREVFVEKARIGNSNQLEDGFDDNARIHATPANECTARRTFKGTDDRTNAWVGVKAVTVTVGATSTARHAMARIMVMCELVDTRTNYY